jgi:hypothetical protein
MVMEHEKEHHHAEATKRVDERREERDRRNQATQQMEQVEDEIPHQKSRHQNRSDQCQQRRVFKCHARSMNVASVSRNSGFCVGAAHPSERRRATRGSIVSDC